MNWGFRARPRVGSCRWTARGQWKALQRYFFIRASSVSFRLSEVGYFSGNLCHVSLPLSLSTCWKTSECKWTTYTNVILKRLIVAARLVESDLNSPQYVSRIFSLDLPLMFLCSRAACKMSYISGYYLCSSIQSFCLSKVIFFLLRVLSLRSNAVHLCTLVEYQNMTKLRGRPEWKNHLLELFRRYYETHWVSRTHKMLRWNSNNFSLRPLFLLNLDLLSIHLPR